MIVINNNPDKRVKDKVLWYASHVYTVNQDGKYKILKCRHKEQESKGELTQAEMMSQVEKVLAPKEIDPEDNFTFKF